MALGRVVPARRAIAASSAREGEKARNGELWIVVSVKSLEKLILDVFWVVDHDSDLKNRCSTGRFRVIAIHILSLTGGSMILVRSKLKKRVQPRHTQSKKRRLAIIDAIGEAEGSGCVIAAEGAHDEGNAIARIRGSG